MTTLTAEMVTKGNTNPTTWHVECPDCTMVFTPHTSRDNALAAAHRHRYQTCNVDVGDGC